MVQYWMAPVEVFLYRVACILVASFHIAIKNFWRNKFRQHFVKLYKITGIFSVTSVTSVVVTFPVFFDRDGLVLQVLVFQKGDIWRYLFQQFVKLGELRG